MKLIPVLWSAELQTYEAQAQALLAAWSAGDDDAVRCFRHRHPRFLDPDVPWKPRDAARIDLRAIPIDSADARLALARWYDFADWPALADFTAEVADPGGPVARFETAVEAVVDGDLATLAAGLGADPGLVRARSTRRTHFDPPVHGATLLHYLAANGVEGHRQRTPSNAVEVARLLLERGADPNALAGFYGGRHATLSLLVSSEPPARAGLQPALVDVLVGAGASVEPVGSGRWTSPLHSALAFGFGDAAEALVRRGARVDLASAAGLGRVEELRSLLRDAGSDERHRALALAAQNGQAQAVALLLDAGLDPDRFNPEGLHAHSTSLHQAAQAGHDAVVHALVERGARLDLRDKLWNATPLGWAVHAGRTATAAYLRSRGAID